MLNFGALDSSIFLLRLSSGSSIRTQHTLSDSPTRLRAAHLWDSGAHIHQRKSRNAANIREPYSAILLPVLSTILCVRLHNGERVFVRFVVELESVILRMLEFLVVVEPECASL